MFYFTLLSDTRWVLRLRLVKYVMSWMRCWNNGPLHVTDPQTERATVCGDEYLCHFLHLCHYFTYFYGYFVHFLCLSGCIICFCVFCVFGVINIELCVCVAVFHQLMNILWTFYLSYLSFCLSSRLVSVCFWLLCICLWSFFVVLW